MNWLNWLFLGVLQGLTEFLPVSSSGHLVLAQSLLGMQVPGIVLEVSVHVATAAAVVVLFAGEIWRMILALIRWPSGRRSRLDAATAREDQAWRGLVTNIIVATAVTTAIGLAFQPFFRGAFESPVVAAAMLLVTGGVLFAVSRLRAGRKAETGLGPSDAIWVGAAQGLAILPGLSRSGLTIAGGLTRGLSGKGAARFSFLLSLPAIIGAALLEVIEADFSQAALAGIPATGLAIAIGAAFLSGLFAMVLLIRLVERGYLHRFAYYCWAVGLMALVWLGLR